MEVVSIRDFEKMVAEREDNVITSAVDQLEFLASTETAKDDSLRVFGDAMNWDPSTASFDFVQPNSSAKWPGPSYSPLVVHDKIKKAAKPTRLTPRRPFAPFVRARRSKIPPAPGKPSAIEPNAKQLVCKTGPRSRQSTHLLNLPPEIRNSIWNLLAVHKTPMEAQLRRIHPLKPAASAANTIRRFPLEPKVAFTNRQLREEVLSIFYGANHFIFRGESNTRHHNLRMNDNNSMRRWQPPSNIAKFVSSIDVRFATDFTSVVAAAGFNIVHTFRRSPKGELITEVKFERSATIHGAGALSYCLCDEEESVHRTKELAHLNGDSLVSIAIAMLAARSVVRCSDTAKLIRAGVPRRPSNVNCEVCGKKKISCCRKSYNHTP